MPHHLQKLRTLRLLAAGIFLMLTVSLAAAAIVMWMPDPPSDFDQDQKVAGNLSEYVLLHRARNAVVPPYLRIDIDDTPR